MMDSVYPKINTHLEPCVNVSNPRATCGRHKLCTRCTNLTARRKTAEVYSKLKMLQELRPWIEIGGVLTRTLPGIRHPIRRSPLYKQYEHWKNHSRWYWPNITRRRDGELCRVRTAFGHWCSEHNVIGMSDFLEVVQNKETRRWHLHSHAILFQDSSNPITIQPSVVELTCKECGLDLEDCDDHSHWVQPEFGRKVGGRWSKALKYCGFGERYSWDPGIEVDIGYLTKLSYNTKPIQFKDKFTQTGLRELSQFFSLSRPRLVTHRGDVRITKAERTLYDDIKNQ